MDDIWALSHHYSSLQKLDLLSPRIPGSGRGVFLLPGNDSDPFPQVPFFSSVKSLCTCAASPSSSHLPTPYVGCSYPVDPRFLIPRFTLQYVHLYHLSFRFPHHQMVDTTYFRTYVQYVSHHCYGGEYDRTVEDRPR